MSNGYVRGKTDEGIPFIAAADIRGGDVMQVAGVSGVVAGSSLIKTGEKAILWPYVRADVASASGTTFAPGAAVNWDDTAKLAVSGAGDFPLGIAGAAGKSSGELKVEVLFNMAATA